MGIFPHLLSTISLVLYSCSVLKLFPIRDCHSFQPDHAALHFIHTLLFVLCFDEHMTWLKSFHFRILPVASQKKDMYILSFDLDFEIPFRLSNPFWHLQLWECPTVQFYPSINSNARCFPPFHFSIAHQLLITTLSIKVLDTQEEEISRMNCFNNF